MSLENIMQLSVKLIQVGYTCENFKKCFAMNLVVPVSRNFLDQILFYISCEMKAKVNLWWEEQFLLNDSSGFFRSINVFWKTLYIPCT